MLQGKNHCAHNQIHYYGCDALPIHKSGVHALGIHQTSVQYWLLGIKPIIKLLKLSTCDKGTTIINVHGKTLKD